MLFYGSQNPHLLHAIRSLLEFSPIIISMQCASGQMVARCKIRNGHRSAA